MLKMQHTFMNRENTNDKIMKTANDTIQKNKKHKNKIIETIEKKHCKNRELS